MGIRTAIKPLGSRKGRYKKGTVLCSLSAGQSAIITFYPGIYYIRGQGAGAGGGNYAYPWGHGTGAGSGAGFEGYIKILKKVEVTVTAGKAGISATDGTATFISNIINLDGGKAGFTNQGGIPDIGGLGGVITIDTSNLNKIFYIKSYSVKSNGKSGTKQTGGNSVLTNDGGGEASGGNATTRGAGGGGTSGIGGKGGIGGDGELLIRYEGL